MEKSKLLLTARNAIHTSSFRTRSPEYELEALSWNWIGVGPQQIFRVTAQNHIERAVVGSPTGQTKFGAKSCVDGSLFATLESFLRVHIPSQAQLKTIAASWSVGHCESDLID